MALIDYLDFPMVGGGLPHNVLKITLGLVFAFSQVEVTVKVTVKSFMQSSRCLDIFRKQISYAYL